MRPCSSVKPYSAAKRGGPEPTTGALHGAGIAGDGHDRPPRVARGVSSSSTDRDGSGQPYSSTPDVDWFLSVRVTLGQSGHDGDPVGSELVGQIGGELVHGRLVDAVGDPVAVRAAPRPEMWTMSPPPLAMSSGAAAAADT